MVKLLTIDDYVRQLPKDMREQAQALRATIMNAANGLVETVRYDMPAYQYGDITVIHFAFWKEHIGLYPVYRGTPSFEARIGPYRAKRESVHFPLKEPHPHELIAEIVESQMSHIAK